MEKSRDYEIELNTDLAPSQPYEYAVGSVTPTYTSSPTKNNMSYTSALIGSTFLYTPYKAGIWASSKIDQAMRAFDQNDDMVNRDPEFNPFKVWKDGGYEEKDFYSIQKLNNNDELMLWQTLRAYEKNRDERIAQSGIAGNIAAFAAAVATDPITYAGAFGAGKLLASGASKTVAFGAAGTLGSAAYEAEQQLFDFTDSRAATDSAYNIAAGAVIGGVLGKAVDSFSTFRSKGLLQNKQTDFNLAAKEYTDDAINMDQKAESLSAMAVSDMSKGTAIRGGMAKGGAHLLRSLGLKMRGQTMADPESRIFIDKLVGRNLVNEADAAGIAASDSIESVNRMAQGKSLGDIARHLDELESTINKNKEVYDEATKKRALLSRYSGNWNPEGKDVTSVLTRQMDDFFTKKWATDLKDAGATWFKERKNYFPMIMKPELVGNNIDLFAQKMVKRLNVEKTKAVDDIVAWTKELDLMQKAKAPQSEIDELAEAIQFQKSLSSEAAEDTLFRAKQIAHSYASRMAHEDGTGLSPFASKAIPSRMKQRLLDAEEFIDFIEVDPHKLMVSYALEVSPHYASQKVFGDKSPMAAMKKTIENLVFKSTEAAAKGDMKLANKINKDIKEISDAVPKAWNEYTGMLRSVAGLAVSDVALDLIQAAKDFTYMAKMGGQTFGSLPDLASINIAHGIKGFSEFTRIISKTATSPAIREMSRETAGALGIGLEVALRSFLAEIQRNDFMRLSANSGSGWSQYVAKGARIGANTMQFANASLLFDSVLRRMLVTAQQQLLKGNIEAAIAGKARPNVIADMAWMGIGKGDYKKIMNYAKKHGEVVENVFFFRPEKWGQTGSVKVDQTKALQYIKSNYSDPVKRRVGLIDWLEEKGKQIKDSGSKAAMHQTDDPDRALARLLEEQKDSLPDVIKQALYKEIALDQETGESLNALTDGIRGTHIFNLRLIKDDYISNSKNAMSETRNYVSDIIDEQGKALGDKMISALIKDNGRISIKPGVGDTPHVFKQPGFNLITQFKSWAVTATQVYGLAALQRGDANHMAGLVTMIGMASLFSMLKDYANGKEVKTDPDEILWQGIANSGMIGVMQDFGGNYFARKWFDLESGGAKYVDYQDLKTTLMGPLASTLTDVSGVLKPAAQAVGLERPEFNDTWLKNLIDVSPIPFVKGLTKEYFTN